MYHPDYQGNYQQGAPQHHYGHYAQQYPGGQQWADQSQGYYSQPVQNWQQGGHYPQQQVAANYYTEQQYQGQPAHYPQTYPGMDQQLQYQQVMQDPYLQPNPGQNDAGLEMMRAKVEAYDETYVNPYDYEDYSQQLQSNDPNAYVRPLSERERLHAETSDDFRNATEEGVSVGFRERGFRPKMSPVDVPGLQPITSFDLGEPPKTPEEKKRERELQEEQLRPPRASEAAMKPISVSRAPGSDVKNYMREREHALDDVTIRDPPPEAIRCGWREYQGGATWQDITMYRDYELGHWQEEQRQQQAYGDSPVYYY